MINQDYLVSYLLLVVVCCALRARKESIHAVMVWRQGWNTVTTKSHRTWRKALRKDNKSFHLMQSFQRHCLLFWRKFIIEWIKIIRKKKEKHLFKVLCVSRNLFLSIFIQVHWVFFCKYLYLGTCVKWLQKCIKSNCQFKKKLLVLQLLLWLTLSHAQSGSNINIQTRASLHFFFVCKALFFYFDILYYMFIISYLMSWISYGSKLYSIKRFSENILEHDGTHHVS